MTPAENFDLSAVQRRRKRALGVSLALPTVALLFTQSLWVVDGPAHLSIEWIGLALIVVCILGRTWCALYLGGKKKRELVRHGPYSVVRNPLYVFSAIGAAGVGLCAGSLVIGMIFGAACVAIFDLVIRKEEVYLAGQFGASYGDYRAQVPRWLPDFSLWRDVERIEGQPRLILLTFRDALVFLGAFPILESFEELQATGYLPVWLYLP